jgi:hypothetical protein
MELQAKAKNSRSRVLMGLAVLLAVVTLAIFFMNINFARHPDQVNVNSDSAEESLFEEESYSTTTHLDALYDAQQLDTQHLGKTPGNAAVL